MSYGQYFLHVFSFLQRHLDTMTALEEELDQNGQCWNNSLWRGPGVMIVSADGRLMEWRVWDAEGRLFDFLQS